MNPNMKNRTVFQADNIDVLRGMNSDCVDLIYLDPPFNSNRSYSAPVGSEAAGAEFKDTWTLSDKDKVWHKEIEHTHQAAHAIITMARIAHGKGMMSYLIMMAIRLLEMHRVLKETGSIYLHCDPTASHYLKMLMDAIFGKDNFRNEIVWCYKSGGASPKRKFSSKHDVIIYFSKHPKRYTFNPQSEKSYNRELKPYRFRGVKEYEDKTGWYTLVGMKDYWNIDMIGRTSGERLGYPTQKPLALLERIIVASSNEGDVVLDPFCGCATTLVAAERHKRQWIGIDLSPMAVKLVRQRLQRERDLALEAGAKGQRPLLPKGFVKELDTLPRRTDQGKLPPYNCKENKTYLYAKQDADCALCGEHFKLRNLEVDHIVPQAKGGTDHLGNLQLLCGHCNRVKGTKTQEEAIVALREEGVI